MIRCGVDIEQIHRFENRDSSFFEGIFTPNEIGYCRGKSLPAQHFCGIYCAKEALSKALSGIARGLCYLDLEISHDDAGRPFFIRPDCLAMFETDVSISHSGDMATAVVVLFCGHSMDYPSER